MDKKISVIIPTLNESENIAGCIKHLVNQTKKPTEIIVVDNGSEDKTREIIKEIKKKNPNLNLRLFYYPYGNQIEAREFGIKKAVGEIIASIDAEANPRKDWIENINEIFEDQKIVGVGGKSSFRNKGKIFNFFYRLTYYYTLIGLHMYCIGGGNSAFRKSAFESVNGYKGLRELRKKENIHYAKDDYFLTRKLERVGKIKFCPELFVTILYRIRNKEEKKYKKLVTIKEVIKRAYLELKYNLKISKYFRKKVC